MKKIDFHVHVTPPDISANWKKYAEKEPYFSVISNNKYNKFAAAEDVIDMLDACGFDKAVVFGFAFTDMGLCRYVNDYVIENAKKYSERLTGFAVVPPSSADVKKEIERCLSAGLAGTGELFPAGQNINIDNQKEMSALAGVCKEANIPLLLHANEAVGHSYSGKTDVSLKQLETFIVNNPDVNIVLAHWGGGLFFYETMTEVRESFRNVYYDTAITPFLYDAGVYRAARALNLCDKILFGSDFPILPPSRYINAINEESGFTDDEIEKILGGNALRLLKMPY
ncbi:MAG: amidohydrolase family protein [Treponema sp.]|nr:amidohydrolase family protein [Treponema sp.]MCL2271912.1 amidohydrolase family protein [Treponema sp.]